jgi:hypothetical protein
LISEVGRFTPAPGPRRVESVHEIEEGVRGTDVRVVQHIVCQQIAGVQPFLVEPVETDASASARTGGQSDEALDAADDGEEKSERDPYAAIESGPGSDSSSLTVRSGCRASSRTVAQPILRR